MLLFTNTGVYGMSLSSTLLHSMDMSWDPLATHDSTKGWLINTDVDTGCCIIDGATITWEKERKQLIRE